MTDIVVHASRAASTKARGSQWEDADVAREDVVARPVKRRAAATERVADIFKNASGMLPLASATTRAGEANFVKASAVRGHSEQNAHGSPPPVLPRAPKVIASPRGLPHDGAEHVRRQVLEAAPATLGFPPQVKLAYADFVHVFQMALTADPATAATLLSAAASTVGPRLDE